MKKRIVLMFLALAMILALAACGAEPVPDSSGDPEPPQSMDDGSWSKRLPSGDDRPEKHPLPGENSAGPGEPGESGGGQEEAPPAGTSTGGTAANPMWFEESLQSYLEDGCGWSGSSYMVSPASFRAALCLAIEGAGGDTREALMSAAKFGSDDEMERWYGDLLAAREDFMARYGVLKAESENYGDGSDPGMAFDIANAIWDNSSIDGGFKNDYISALADKYGAAAASSPADQITSDVNAWCDEATHGMIKNISNDLSGASAVLANALYVKSAWVNPFSGYMTEKGDFTKASGDVSGMDFMRQVDDFRYSEDRAGRKYAAFGLEGGLWLTVCLDADVRVYDLYSAMYDSSYELLDVAMPKMDLETSLDHGELPGFLAACGAGGALSDGADFSAMTDSPYGWHIGDIVQKTRLKTDEDGLEAAAVTMVAMADNAAVIEPKEPIEFHMDRPFSFLVTQGLHTRDAGATVLFFGRFAG